MVNTTSVDGAGLPHERPFAHLGAVSTWTPAGRHNRRVRALMQVGGVITLVMSSVWCLVLLGRGDLYGAFVCVVATLTGAAMTGLVYAGRLRLARNVMAHGLLIALVLASLFEIPVPGAPRSVFFNLLPVIAATYLIFRKDDGVYFHVVLPLVGLLAFLGFSLDVIPPIRGLGAQVPASWTSVWANHITGTVATCIVVVMMQANVNARRAMEGDIRRAIAKGEFHLHYQPQVDAEGRMCGVEALLRWQHPTRGNIPPNAFIPLAEETGLIIPIGEWVLRAACAQLREWAASPQTAHLTIAVNVSVSQFRQPDFVEQVKAIVSISGAPAAALKLELTESALVCDMETVTRKMQALKQAGIGWALDDFGTGYSSLSTLKNLPFDQVKIDRSFVQDLPGDARSRAIVETILRLGETLGLTVIAEGVETRDQLALLEQAGCRHFQGYLFGRPVPVAELALADVDAAA